MAPIAPSEKEAPLWHRFVAGGLGDATAACFSHPADVLKVRLQLTGEGDPTKRSLTAKDFGQAARRLALHEGVKNGLYAGISASFVRQLSFSGMRHGLCGVFERKWAASSHEGQVTLLGRASCATLAGFTAACLTSPCDLVLIRMQSDGFWPKEQRREYRHVFDGFSKILRNEGVARMWRGVGPTAARAVLVTTSQVVTYAEAKIALKAAGVSEGTSLHLACAMTSATVACFATCPVDVVKTRVMNMQKSGGISYKGPMDCVMQTMRSEGPLGFYKGLSATFLRLWPHTVILWLAQEQYGHWLKEYF